MARALSFETFIKTCPVGDRTCTLQSFDWVDRMNLVRTSSIRTEHLHVLGFTPTIVVDGYETNPLAGHEGGNAASRDVEKDFPDSITLDASKMCSCIADDFSELAGDGMADGWESRGN
jgi:hypothetical protein